MSTDKLIAVLAGTLSVASPNLWVLVALVLIVLIATMPGILRGVADIIRAKRGAPTVTKAGKPKRRLASRRSLASSPQEP